MLKLNKDEFYICNIYIEYYVYKIATAIKQPRPRDRQADNPGYRSRGGAPMISRTKDGQ